MSIGETFTPWPPDTAHCEGCGHPVPYNQIDDDGHCPGCAENYRIYRAEREQAAEQLRKRTIATAEPANDEQEALANVAD